MVVLLLLLLVVVVVVVVVVVLLISVYFTNCKYVLKWYSLSNTIPALITSALYDLPLVSADKVISTAILPLAYA